MIIFIFDEDHDCPANETSLICNDIEIGVCCFGSESTDFPTLQVSGLDTDPTSANVAIAFSLSGDNRCGVACDSAFAENNACLDCDGFISGGGWNILPSEGESTESLSSCTSSIEPDELKYQGRSYNIYHDVPASISAELIDLVKKNIDVSDFPEHLSQYEKKGMK